MMRAIRLEDVMKSNFPAVIRMIAQQLSQHSYLDVGTFLKELNKTDLKELVGYCVDVTVGKDSGASLDNICLLAEMIAQAEGSPIDEPDITRISNLMILLNFEDLARKGVIEFDRSKATLGADLETLNLAHLK